MRRRRFLAASLLALTGAAAAAPGCGWPAWDAFGAHYIEAGRVVDPATPARYSTSEGQAYALLFALVANDRAQFERLLDWTARHLAGGDLGAQLPAWRWGRLADGGWGVADANAAADADLWLAYVLGEAARLWRHAPYAATARRLAARILREESRALPGLGRVLLPGPQGFVAADATVRLNPSYLPLQVLRRLAAVHPDPGWRQLLRSAPAVILQGAPHGFAPDWLQYRPGTGFLPDAPTQAAGSYDAIRVYLWAGMLAPDDPARARLLRHFAPLAQLTAASGIPPETVDTRSGAARGDGPPGFSAALLPLLAARGERAEAARQRARLAALAEAARDNYYDQVLALFGTGFDGGRFRFARDGRLQVNWTCATN